MGNELVKISDLSLAALDPDSEVAEIMEEALAGEGIGPGDLPRVKWPSGGATSFERTVLGEVENLRTIKGIVVHMRMTRSYWPDPEPKEGVEPDCRSQDGKYGYGTPGDALRAQNPPVGCASCPMAQFGSARDKAGNPKRGQACNLRRELFILSEGAIFPLIVSIPPASLKNGKDYFVDLASFGIRYYHVLTELSLAKASSKDGQPYAEAVVKSGGRLDDGAKEAVNEYRGRMLDQLTAVPVVSDAMTVPDEPADKPVAEAGGKGEEVPE